MKTIEEITDEIREEGGFITGRQFEDYMSEVAKTIGTEIGKLSARIKILEEEIDEL